jgi:hypothetical protein
VTPLRNSILVTLARLAAALAVFAAVHGYVAWYHGSKIGLWVVGVGQAFGMNVTQLSGKYVSPHPFDGAGFWAAAWNHAYALGPPVICAMAAWLAAAAVFAAYGGLGSLRRSRDGLTRCGGCGYILSGLKEPRCPECGRAI